MKLNMNLKALGAIAMGASLFTGVAWAAQSGGGMMPGCQMGMGSMGATGGMTCCPSKTVPSNSAVATQATKATQAKSLQKATIVINDGYSPSVINAKAGKPLQLTFVAKTESCANSVVIPSLRKTVTVATGTKPTTFTFTPKKGTTGFNCSMGMFHGKIVAS